MAWGAALRVTVAEFIEPMLVRFGVTKLPYYSRLAAIFEGISIGSPLLPLQTGLKIIGESMAKNTATKALWGWVVFDIMQKVATWEQDLINTLENKAKAIWDKHAGDLGNYFIELGALYATEFVSKATLEKTGVALTLHLALPMDAAQVEIIGADVGAWLAEVANAKIGTNFVSLYPPENLKVEIRNQIMSELTTGGRNILSEADVQAFIIQLNQIRDNQLVQQFGVSVQAAVGMGLPLPPENLQADTKLARRRAQGRARQREYRRTHTRTYGPWTPPAAP